MLAQPGKQPGFFENSCPCRLTLNGLVCVVRV
jgi:hypothetical protein